LIKQYYNHDIFISPSLVAQDGDTEGGAPVTLLEASATGMPVLSTFHCDIPEVVINSQSGYLVPEGDVDALVDRLRDLINNPDRRLEFGEYGRAHMQKNHNLRQKVKQMSAYYSSLIQDTG
jgi:colanic acid/amylovoran biosynthesis glycosyltransferase